MAKKPVRKTGRRKPSDVVYCGPEGWVILRKNGRTKLWEAHCQPEGSTRHVTVPMKSIRKADAKEEAIFTLRHECQHLLISRPSSDHAKDAVRTLIAYAGDNPNREGLRDTPERVVRAYDEFFSGYQLAARDVLKTTFSETGAYDEMVVLTDIDFESHCEHHMVPFVGAAHIAYLPNKTVVGISKLARLVEVYAKRLQIQEKMTTQIADNLNITLKPKGVAVVVEAQHQCMTSRGVKKKNVKMVTSCMTGVFREDGRTRSEFMNMIGNPRNRGS